jgi:hypothetical protein
MVKTLDHTDLQGGVQLFEYHPEGGTHGSGTDKQHIYSFSGHMSSPFGRKQWDSGNRRRAFGAPDRIRTSAFHCSGDWLMLGPAHRLHDYLR